MKQHTYQHGKGCIYNVAPITLMQWEKDAILSAFERCKGLRVAISSLDGKTALEGLKSLSLETGYTVGYLSSFINEIKTL